MSANASFAFLGSTKVLIVPLVLKINHQLRETHFFVTLKYIQKSHFPLIFQHFLFLIFTKILNFFQKKKNFFNTHSTVNSENKPSMKMNFFLVTLKSSRISHFSSIFRKFLFLSEPKLIF